MAWLALRAALGLAVVTVAAFGVGSWIGLLLPSGFRRFERAAFVLLGGFGILSTALFLVGQVWFTRRAIGLTLGVAIAMGIAMYRRVCPRKAQDSSSRSEIPIAPAVIVVSLLAFTAVCGLAEITGDWNSDTVSYHLLGPKVWLRDGIIRPVLDNCHTAFPQIPETLFAALWSVGASRAPNFSSFLTLGLLLVVAASVAIRLGLGDGDAWWVAAIVATMPAVYVGAHGCFVDAIFAAFVLAAARIGIDAEGYGEWAAFGMFCGFAVGTKYTGLLAVAALMPCVILFHSKQGGPRARGIAGRLAVAMAAVFLIGSAYYIRNWILLGCPIYPPPPGYAHFCSPKYLSADNIARFHAYIRHRGMGMGRGLLAFLLLPFNLTYHTANFHGAGGIGLCPLALGPMGIWWSRKNRLTWVLVSLMFLLTAAWFVTQQESRFLIHAYVFGAVFTVLGWRGVLASGRKAGKYLAGAVVAISCAYGLFMIARANVDDARAVFSARYAEARREAAIPYLASFEYLNSEPSVRRVLILDSGVMPYYSDKDYIKPVGQWGERTLPGGIDASQALELAREHKLDVSHVMDVESDTSGFRVSANMPGLALVFEAEHQRIYRVE